ncbi:helix-turn-helix transcriptional regulator [Rhodococcus aetherivorans]|uniref:Helix-turn-helix domain-containing protein n=1 Tax=Rhodococcus aetherivorans TaxID=191292 RepID=A0A059MJ25_9NOCA|nr:MULTISPECIES: helix-turn-helix domain-containing protein [Rhodococcus]ETT28871.1 putative transcriptional regulator [Rhodococcus rhodochrous ATCC 21198]KDE11185.1 transcriptional regulator [Rhodococcus aetherivorans]MDV6293053.1 helix-turn-helix domain-containing protein [Rhodococcus aetherivorans]NGP25791.1 helix-turn-helix domain-containing protein [Rhodococcus aetherivorans]QIX52788.1 helix-turn-helix domain-containing protein [Rhodococcus sp. DMU1]
MQDEFAEQASGIGALADPARRSLYRYVAAQADAVGREQAAAAVGLPLHAARFHLDRLVEEGLLETEYRRLSGRTGPGAGRPSKLYRRSSRELSISLPERRYDLAGEVLAAAIERSMRDSVPIAEAVRTAAVEHGRRIAANAATPAVPAGTVPGPMDAGGTDLERMARLLARHGYEPRLSGDGQMRLANCPFDRLANEHRELVCGMNLALLDGVVAGLGTDRLCAELAPEPGFCCVRIRGVER